jgi:o-succinylbenzoate synthase
MKLDSVELIHVRLPLVAPFETSLGRIEIKDAVLVRGEADGLTGWAEVAAWYDPWYSYETVDTSLYVLERYLIPRAIDRDVSAIDSIDPWPEVRGYPMAKAALQVLALDLLAQAEAQPLARRIGGVRSSVDVGISLGIEPSVEALLDRIATAVDNGYQRVKVKIKPGWDVAVVAAIRERFGDSLPLMVDANGAYRLSDAEHLASLDIFGLTMIEQPLDYDDLDDHAALSRRLRTPICLDESVPNLRAVRRALALGSCRVVNVKHGRLGGPVTARAVHDSCADAGVAVFCGGMLETGIGRAANVAVASLPNFTVPGDLSASNRYFERDLIDPPFVLNPGGVLDVPDRPGLGVDVDEDFLRECTISSTRVAARAIVR